MLNNNYHVPAHLRMSNLYFTDSYIYFQNAPVSRTASLGVSRDVSRRRVTQLSCKRSTRTEVTTDGRFKFGQCWGSGSGKPVQGQQHVSAPKKRLYVEVDALPAARSL